MKRVLWKIYFFLLLAIAVITYIWQGFARFWGIIDLVIFILAMVGLYAYIWRKELITKIFWKVFFIITIFWNIFYLYILPLPEKVLESFEQSGMSNFTGSTLSLILFIPLIVALYLYAFGSLEEPADKSATP